MKRTLAVTMLLLASVWHLCATAQVRVTDDRGVTLEFAQPPQRIVTLLPSLTETICALDACARLIGVDRYSNWPQAVTRLPQLGGMLDPNIEAIVKLRPDLVVLGVSSRATTRLEASGIKVFALEQKSYEGVHRAIDTLGAILALQDADGLWQRIQQEVNAIAQGEHPQVRRARVYFEVGTGSYAAGESSFIGQTLARLGARNVVPAALGPFPKLNPEYVVRADPEVLMMPHAAALTVTTRPGWKRMRAVQEHRICAFSRSQADVLMRPGPRIPEAARLMADCLDRTAPEQGWRQHAD